MRTQAADAEADVGFPDYIGLTKAVDVGGKSAGRQRELSAGIAFNPAGAVQRGDLERIVEHRRSGRTVSRVGLIPDRLFVRLRARDFVLTKGDAHGQAVRVLNDRDE